MSGLIGPRLEIGGGMLRSFHKIVHNSCDLEDDAVVSEGLDTTGLVL